MLNIFIGWDSREPVAFSVLAHSILARASYPVSITALIQRQVRNSNFYSREREATESTEFSLTRFLVPFLSGYKGLSLFMDCDMLCQADICDLEYLVRKEQMMDRNKAVWVCQHEYTPKTTSKFLGQQQTTYPRKNWSSLMLFNNAKCKALTTEYVNSASGLDLHRFNWLKDEEIGSLPLDWNWLVGEYPHRGDAKILHYTLGGPWFGESDYAEEWSREHRAMSGVGVGVGVGA